MTRDAAALPTTALVAVALLRACALLAREFETPGAERLVADDDEGGGGGGAACGLGGGSDTIGAALGATTSAAGGLNAGIALSD